MTWYEESVAEVNLNVPQFVGDIYYVDAGQADDTGVGTSPGTAKQTIGAAITACAAGDAITIKAGTYTEIGLDVNKNAVELWFEIGVLIDPATGTSLTLSGNSCRITGMSKVTPAAGQIGLLVSGTECHIEHMKVSTGGTGYKLTGAGTMLVDCASGNQTSIAYDIQAGQARLTNCKTVGVGATYGYYINSGADTGVIDNCTSVGHTAAGYYIDTLSQDWTIFNCSSGAGDGKWVDVDTANVWSNFSYDDIVYATATFTGAGAGSINLFRVYGSVLITGFSGEIDTVLAADVGTLYVELYDGTNTIDVTDSPGPDVSSVPTHSYLHKIDDASVQIAVQDSTQVRLYEDATKDGRDPNFQITAKEGAATYVRITYSGTGTTGAIHWHIKWEPLDEDGFVDVA
jgi:hypothetical protein